MAVDPVTTTGGLVGATWAIRKVLGLALYEIVAFGESV